MEEENVFYGKTKEEAENNALLSMNGKSRDEVEFIVLEEGKKKLFGSTKWKITVREKRSDGARAVQFIDGLLKILKIEGNGELVSEEENIKIEIKTPSGARVIGKRGDILDAIQCMAGAVANIGREDYVKVVVDCENYRSQREETLVSLAQKVAKKAEETGRKVNLEPMNPYERRIIHSALKDSQTVKTASEGREPARYVAVIPNNANPADRGIRYGERRERRFDKGERGERRQRRFDKGERGERRERRGDRPRGSAPKRGKKEIIFGTYLGNSGAGKSEDENKE